MKKMKLLLFAFFLLAFGQVISQEEIPTPHLLGFKIESKDPNLDLSKYEKAAMGYYYFDQFRFLDKRRVLSFEDGKVTISLYSANEMLKNTQKLISPFTIKEGSSYKNYILAITLDGGSLKPMPIE